jgi:UDP-glucose 4-epimerase
MDLAAGHVAAVKSGRSSSVNLGTGRGASVLQVNIFFIPAVGAPPNSTSRAYDVASCYRTGLGQAVAHWQANLDVQTMRADVIGGQSQTVAIGNDQPLPDQR